MKAIIKIEQLILLFALGLQFSCDSQSPQLRDFNSGYLQNKKYFNESFIDHFPKEIESLPSVFELSRDIRRSHPSLKLKTFYDSPVISSIHEKIKQIAIAKYNSSDTCLLLIDKHLAENNWRKYDKTLRVGPEVENINLDCHRGKFPIPKFWRNRWRENNETQIGLNPGYTLYVLEAKAGTFMDESELPNGKYTPFGWEHGYTKGIAINEEENSVIYWFDIW
jgi:hypothetical protein